MLGSPILDVAIGMIFVYLLLSLICSAANEVIELLLKGRASQLEEGLRELLHSESSVSFFTRINNSLRGQPAIANAENLVQRVYEHPLISSLYKGDYKPNSTKLPSYIPSTNFALALMDLVPTISADAKKAATGETKVADTAVTTKPEGAAVLAQSGAAFATAAPPSAPPSPQVVVNVPGVPAPEPAQQKPPDTTATSEAGSSTPADPLKALRDALQNFPYPKARNALLPLIDAAGNDAVKARQNIEDWYNASMDRVSGWYKRRAHKFILLFGFIIAVLVNADSMALVRALNSDKSLREVVVAQATQYMKEATSPSPTPNDVAKPTGDTSTAGAKPPAAPAQTSAQTKAATSPGHPPICDREPNSPQCKYEKSLDQIQSLGLPMGWDATDADRTWPGVRLWQPDIWSNWRKQMRLHWIGWILTAFAISLGAPFWFDMLNKFIVVRGTVKPKEKSPDEKSKS
jgi:hypothetical protein